MKAFLVLGLLFSAHSFAMDKSSCETAYNNTLRFSRDLGENQSAQKEQNLEQNMMGLKQLEAAHRILKLKLDNSAENVSICVAEASRGDEASCQKVLNDLIKSAKELGYQNREDVVVRKNIISDSQATALVRSQAAVLKKKFETNCL